MAGVYPLREILRHDYSARGDRIYYGSTVWASVVAASIGGAWPKRPGPHAVGNDYIFSDAPTPSSGGARWPS